MVCSCVSLIYINVMLVRLLLQVKLTYLLTYLAYFAKNHS